MKYIKIGGAYQLIEDFEIKTIIIGYDIETDLIKLSKDGMLLLRKHYCWDGPSGGFNTRSFIIGSGVHDPLCILVNLWLLPTFEQCKVDEQMLMINRNQKMFVLRRWWTYAVVRFYQMRKKKLFKPKVYEIHMNKSFNFDYGAIEVK